MVNKGSDGGLGTVVKAVPFLIQLLFHNQSLKSSVRKYRCFLSTYPLMYGAYKRTLQVVLMIAKTLNLSE